MVFTTLFPAGGSHLSVSVHTKPFLPPPQSRMVPLLFFPLLLCADRCLYRDSNSGVLFVRCRSHPSLRSTFPCVSSVSSFSLFLFSFLASFCSTGRPFFFSEENYPLLFPRSSQIISNTLYGTLLFLKTPPPPNRRTLALDCTRADCVSPFLFL